MLFSRPLSHISHYEVTRDAGFVGPILIAKVFLQAFLLGADLKGEQYDLSQKDQQGPPAPEPNQNAYIVDVDAHHISAGMPATNTRNPSRYPIKFFIITIICI